MLSAIDGDPKGEEVTFRIKIWLDEGEEETIIYENKMGETDDSHVGTVL